MLLEEFDSNKNAVFNPNTYSHKIKGFPDICVSFFSKSLIDEIVKVFKPEKIGEIENGTALFPVYKIKYNGQNIAVYQSPVGASACVANFEDAAVFGFKKFILCGSCGCLDKNLEDYSIIIPTSAIRDEGTSYHYAKASDEIKLNGKTIKKIENKLKELKVKYYKGKTWTTDAVYRETPAKVKRRKEQGAITVDMECSAMAAVAKFRGIEFAQIFYGADSLADEEYQPRSIKEHNITKKYKIVPLAFECALNLKD